MKIKLPEISFLLIVLLCMGFRNTRAQNINDTMELKKQLKVMYERDQRARKGLDSIEFVHFIDSTNTIRLEKIIQKYGWPGISLAGHEGNLAAFAVLQHAGLSTQERYFPLLKASAESGESELSHLALLTDRICMRKNIPQIYGSQIVFDEEGKPQFYTIEDEKNVNIRRKNARLESIEEYGKHFGIEYQAPDSLKRPSKKQ